jgi:hypothetical protein
LDEVFGEALDAGSATVWGMEIEKVLSMTFF